MSTTPWLTGTVPASDMASMPLLSSEHRLKITVENYEVFEQCNIVSLLGWLNNLIVVNRGSSSLTPVVVLLKCL